MHGVIKFKMMVNILGLDGSTSAQERERLINKFNTSNNVWVFLLSTKCVFDAVVYFIVHFNFSLTQSWLSRYQLSWSQSCGSVGCLLEPLPWCTSSVQVSCHTSPHPAPIVMTHMFTGSTGMAKRRIAIFIVWSVTVHLSAGSTIDKYLNKECQVCNGVCTLQYHVLSLVPKCLALTLYLSDNRRAFYWLEYNCISSLFVTVMLLLIFYRPDSRWAKSWKVFK